MGRVELLVNRSQKEIDELQRRGVLRAKRLSIALRRAALQSFESGEAPDLNKPIVNSMLPTLRDAMLAAHLRGLLAEQAMIKAGRKKGIRLSVFDNAIAAMGRLLNLDTRALQLQYQTQAIRILNDVADNVDKKLRKTVNELIAEGAHVNEAKKVLRAELDKLGLSGRKDYQLETIFRTQTQLAYGAGRWEADQDPAVQEILWGYTYSAVADSRTRPAHMALDGTTMPKDWPGWDRIWPPNGWNCRCQVIPVFEEEEIVKPKEEIEIDPGFAFNPGRVFSSDRTEPNRKR